MILIRYFILYGIFISIPVYAQTKDSIVLNLITPLDECKVVSLIMNNENQSDLAYLDCSIIDLQCKMLFYNVKDKKTTEKFKLSYLSDYKLISFTNSMICYAYKKDNETFIVKYNFRTKKEKRNKIDFSVDYNTTYFGDDWIIFYDPYEFKLKKVNYKNGKEKILLALPEENYIHFFTFNKFTNNYSILYIPNESDSVFFKSIDIQNNIIKDIFVYIKGETINCWYKDFDNLHYCIWYLTSNGTEVVIFDDSAIKFSNKISLDIQITDIVKVSNIEFVIKGVSSSLIHDLIIDNNMHLNIPLMISDLYFLKIYSKQIR